MMGEKRENMLMREGRESVQRPLRVEALKTNHPGVYSKFPDA